MNGDPPRTQLFCSTYTLTYSTRLLSHFSTSRRLMVSNSAVAYQLPKGMIELSE